MERKNKIKIISLAVAASAVFVGSANAQIVRNTAQMQAMDKITGKVEIIDIPVNTEVKYGSFSVVVRSCKTRPPEETPENFAFVDVVDNPIKAEPVNIFKGWMLSSNPAINPVEHPIYDIWLLKCYNTEIDEEKQLSAEDLRYRDLIESTQIVPSPKVEKTDPFSEIIDAGLDAGEEEMLSENSEEEQKASEPIENVEASFVEFSVSEDIEPEAEQLPLPAEENESSEPASEHQPEQNNAVFIEEYHEQEN